MKITMIGNCTVLIETGGMQIITDPYFDHAGKWIFERLTLPAKTREELRDVDLVLISHDHWDHTDSQYLRLLPNGTPVVVPQQVKMDIESQGAKNVVGTSTWETQRFGEITVTAVPASHMVPTVGFIVQSEGKQVYFAGDTHYRPFMKEIGRRFQIDVALLPVSSDRFPLTMNAKDALRAVKALSPRVVVPIHLGVAMRLPILRTDHTTERFQLQVQEAELECNIVILQEGQSREF
jgi:L-ascorbate metabolism protein UlaG (beta-lactamase superfamily)